MDSHLIMVNLSVNSFYIYYYIISYQVSVCKVWKSDAESLHNKELGIVCVSV